MSKFLVVTFDRYETSNSTHTFVEADKPFNALIKVLKVEEDDPEEGVKQYIEYYKEEFMKGSKGFWCVSGEETDYLVYEIS